MSEELLQAVPIKIGRYSYYRLQTTTVGQLMANGLVPQRDYEALATKKPDGILICDRLVKGVVESKQPAELRTPRQEEKAIGQEIEVAKALGRLLIVTDTHKTIWVNALNGDRILDSDGNEIHTVFDPRSPSNRDDIEALLDEIDASIDTKHSNLRPFRLIDPTPLATRLWQTIWVATGKTPVKCLYNVVELFVFKFLSDLHVLADDISFEHIYAKSKADPKEALDYYARNTRHKIYTLFPMGKDGTTIINGTIFVNESGEANLSQSILFARSLQHLADYSEEFGPLTRIDRRFKTRLYETFLKQEAESLGQYFTPRRIVQGMIRMAGLDDGKVSLAGKRICDPFCGVGGFLLEIINLNEYVRSKYSPDRNGKINLPFVVHGFDKGFERDDERTIILAKANMLVYLAEMLFANPTRTEEFARIANETFTLFRDNLGTFGHIIGDDAEKYDFILSNPPYVTRGSSIIKEEIQRTPRTRNQYPVNALGLEGLSVEWIVRSLKPGGRAFIVIPDGILSRVNGRRLRDYVLDECYLDAIVSLPVRTFYANNKHTYILAVTKKQEPSSIQAFPVFCYLVSAIGERLSSVKREPIAEDDLAEMATMFRMFDSSRDASRALLEGHSGRCKLFDIARFRKSTHWVIDRWWTQEEKIKLGLEDTRVKVSKKELDRLLTGLQSAIEELETVYTDSKTAPIATRDVALGDSSLFRLFIGKRVVKRELSMISGDIPLYSANVFEPFGWIKTSNVNGFDHPTILWAIDGNFDFNLIQQGEVFATTDHCGAIQILDPMLIPEYVLYALVAKAREESFNRSFRASLHNMSRFKIAIPATEDGVFDVKAQARLAEAFLAEQEKETALEHVKKQLDEALANYLCGA